MPVDYHIHTKMCGHAVGELDEYVAAARQKGLREIGIADHIPMYFLPVGERDLSIAMKEEELPVYVQRVEEVQKKFSPYLIKLGLEADYIPGKEKELAALLRKYDFDYILGSIHFLDEWGFDNPDRIAGYEKRDLDELYELYFKTLGRAAASGLFDIMAHPDLIKKFGFRPDRDITGLYEQAVKTIAQSGVCIEVNTAGLRVPAGEIYPQAGFLEICHSYQVPVSLGSDAHRPELVGADFDKAVDLLKAIGYREIVTFSKRNKNFYPI